MRLEVGALGCLHFFRNHAGDRAAYFFTPSGRFDLNNIREREDA
jgi:hypothetical protein